MAPADICQHIAKLHGKILTVQDIQNVRNEGKTKHELNSSLEVLEEFSQDHEENTVVLKISSDGELQEIFHSPKCGTQTMSCEIPRVDSHGWNLQS